VANFWLSAKKSEKQYFNWGKLPKEMYESAQMNLRYKFKLQKENIALSAKEQHLDFNLLCSFYCVDLNEYVMRCREFYGHKGRF